MTLKEQIEQLHYIKKVVFEDKNFSEEETTGKEHTLITAVFNYSVDKSFSIDGDDFSVLFAPAKTVIFGDKKTWSKSYTPVFSGLLNETTVDDLNYVHNLIKNSKKEI